MNAKNEQAKRIRDGAELIKDAQTIVDATTLVMQQAEAEFLRILGDSLKHSPTIDILNAMDFLKETVHAHAEAQFTLTQVKIDQQYRERAK